MGLIYISLSSLDNKELTICDPYFQVQEAKLKFNVIDKASDIIGLVCFRTPTDSINTLKEFSIFSEKKLYAQKSKN